MKYRRLGKTNLNVSVVGVGTWQFGGEWGINYTQSEATDILLRAKDLGINLIDTAECYGDHTSEQFIGHAIKDQRKEWILASKFGHKFHANFERSQLFKPAEVILQLEESLIALQTDYLDLYQFHSGSNADFDHPELWDVLAKQVQAGKIRHIGLSVSPNDNVHQISQATKYGIEVVQIVYNRLDRQPEAYALPSCLEQDLGVLARVPLASGLLSGKYKPGTKFTNPDDVRSLRENEAIQEQLREVEKIRQNEVPAGVDMAAWALAWCLENPAVTAVIPGCKNPAQVEANARAVDLVK
jgi:aryl-alcohol dehydrogenase-like predicted oxidoreductase